MKIVIDARESGTTSGRYVDKLIEHIYKIGVDHEITVMTKSHRLDFMRTIAPDFETVAADFKEFTFSEQIGFLRFCRNLKADLIHFPMVQQPLLYHGKKVTTLNDLTTLRFKNPSKNPLLFWTKQKIYGFVNKKVARDSDRILTFTDFVRDDILKYVPNLAKDKFTTTYLAADEIVEKPQPIKQLVGKKYLMYVGRPQPHKNLRRLVDSFVILKKKHPDLQLVLVGKNDELYESHLKYIKDKNIKDITLTGFVSESQLRWLYENCAAYVFPSLSEGFGLPSLEAMIHGAPVVSSNATCLPEVNGDAAHYFDPLDTADIAAKINDVLMDEKLKNKLIQRGKKQVMKYDWKKTAKQTLAIYERALKN